MISAILIVTERRIEFPKPTKHFVIGARGPVFSGQAGCGLTDQVLQLTLC